MNLFKVKGGGAGVTLNNGVRLVGNLKVRAGEEVRTSLVAAGGDRLGDGNGDTLGIADEVKCAGRLRAGGLLDVGKGAVVVGSDESLALDTGGLHGTGLDDGKADAEG